GAGGGGGAGGGASADDKCDLASPQCPAGQSCIAAALPDGGLGSDCFAGACDLVAQDCDAGQKCTYVALPDGGASSLVRGCTAEGAGVEGDGCQPTAGSNTCKSGLICIPSFTSDGGVC